MPNINSLTYNGTKSTDLGVYVTGSGSFDAAEMDADKYEIAGRNGDLIIPKKRFKNIVVTYPAFIPKAFQEKAQSIRNWMRSAKTYARLEDTYDMEHYRLGLASGIQSFEPVNRNDASNFQLSFDCKPQRFLKTGETPLPIEPEAHSYSGEIVEFETVAVDDMTKAEVSLSPIQSLNGYDSPWPAGGGKNLIDADTVWESYRASAGTFNGDSGIGTIHWPIPSALVGQQLTFSMYATASAINSNWRVRATVGGTNTDGTIVTGTAKTLSKVTFTPTSTSDHVSIQYGGSVSAVLTDVQLEKGSTATAYSPYSNICPISGHTGAELLRTGKNLIPTISDGDVIKNGVTFEVKQDGVHATGTATGAIYYNVVVRNAAASPWLVPGTYTLNKTGASQSNVDIMIAEIANQGIIAIAKTSATTFTITEKVQYFSFFYIPSGTVFSDTVLTPQLELGSSATEYEPYQGDTYSVTFTDQGTVYGGTYDWVNGKLTVTRKAVTFDGTQTVGLANWETSAGDGTSAWLYRRSLFPDIKVPTDPTVNIICDRLRPLPYAAGYEGVYGRTNSGICTVPGSANNWSFAMRIPVDGITTATQINAWLANNPVTVVYELATPIEIDLDPTEVQTLLGENVVWAIDGSVEVNYADPFNVNNPTYFEASPLFEITNPAQGDILNVNGKTITFLSSYTGTVTIDCETMDCYSGYANMNYLISATDFPVLNEGLNIVTWNGSGTCTMTPRWWEL